MTFDSFAKTVQTFGSDPDRWETEQRDDIVKWTQTDEGRSVLRQEKELDEQLNLLQPPPCSGLIDKIQSAIIQDKAKSQILLFWRISPWISVLCILCGFYLGWHQSQQNYINMQSYFSTMFDDFNYEQYLQE